VGHSRSSSFQRRGASSRRKPGWSLGPHNVAAQSITSSGATLITVGASALLDGLTIVRLRGELVVWLEVATSIGDGFGRSAFGICAVSENAAGVGISAIPAPIADISWGGWLAYQSIGSITGLSVTESENTGPLTMFRFQMDSKAMRKLRISDVVVGVFETSGEIGAATVNVSLNTRMLTLLA